MPPKKPARKVAAKKVVKPGKGKAAPTAMPPQVTAPANQPQNKTTAPAAAPASALPVPPSPFLNVTVDGIAVQVKRGATVMQACTLAAKEIPHFCYHERLSIAGNCRMCLVEIEGMPKPIASCHWPAAEGMKIKTDSKLTVEARKGTMELLLINHPLDCPICDQGGECALQDQAVAYGSDRSHYHEFKRAVDDKEIGAKIKTVMTRCIHCTRCIRFATEVAGVEEFGATGRGENMQVGTYVEQALQSELAGNMIDLCPVGALTSAPYAYTARPWELARANSVDVLDAIGTPITVDTRAGQVMRTLPRENDEINEEWMTDAARYSYDALNTNRLTTPLVDGKPVGWPEAFAALKKVLADANKTNTAGIMGAMACAEDALSFRMFMDEVLKAPSYASLSGDMSAELPLTFATPLKGFETADAVLLVGCNPRLEAPLLNVRLRRAAIKRRVPIAAIGAAMDLTYSYNNLGEALDTLQILVDGGHPFAETLKNAKQAQVVISSTVMARPDAAAIVALASKLGTVNVLADGCGRITARAMGANKGKTAWQIIKGWQEGRISTLIVHGEDTVDVQDVKPGKGKFIYLGTHNTPLAKIADIVLPTAAWSEKGGLYANAEGRVQEAFTAVAPPLNAKEDWKIYRALSEELGRALPFNNLHQLRNLIAGENAAFKPENRGKIVPQKVLSGKSGKLSGTPLSLAVEKYYLRNEYLRQSPTMHRCQAEQGTASIGHSPVPRGAGPIKPMAVKNATVGGEDRR